MIIIIMIIVNKQLSAPLPLSVLSAPGATLLPGGKWIPTISIFNKLKLRNNGYAMFWGKQNGFSQKKGTKKMKHNLGNQ